MKRNILLIFLTILVLLNSAAIGYYFYHDQQEHEENEEPPFHLMKSSDVDFPTTFSLAGEPVPLERIDVAEAFKKELIVNTYLHSHTIQILKNAPRYFHIIEPILKAEGVPNDFKYLAVIESSLNPIAVSYAGAAGIWQLMSATAKELGLEVTNDVDERYHVEKATRAACSYLKKAYQNQITWKWHVQIPYSYWEKKYPAKDYTPEDRKIEINKYMDQVEQNLCGPDNAEKPLFSMYAVNEANGRIEEEWKIKPLENKYQGSDNLPVSAAANSEILFALMVNPNVMGAGMPGGTYAGNQGGSNIREAFLVNIANAWIDRQNILDPIELYIRINGMPDCELRFRNTILVTLDSGSGTKKTLS